jgi:hypothetical protein
MGGVKRTFDVQSGEVQISELQREFLEWLVDPRTSAEKGTQKAWAEAHGLDQQTPSRWKTDLAFRRAWERRLHELNIDPDRIQKVIDSVYEIAINGVNNADRIKGATLYLQYVNRLSPSKAQPAEEEKPIEDMSDEELEALASNVVELRKSKRAQ